MIMIITRIYIGTSSNDVVWSQVMVVVLILADLPVSGSLLVCTIVDTARYGKELMAYGFYDPGGETRIYNFDLGQWRKATGTITVLPWVRAS